MIVSKNKLNITIEWILIICLMILSLINIPLLLLSIILSSIYFLKKQEGLLKLIVILVFRFIINPGLNLEGSEVYIQSFKYLLLFGVSPIYLILILPKWWKQKNIRSFLLTTFLIFMLLLIPSLIVSQYPHISFLKLVNYFVPLVIIVILVNIQNNLYNFFTWFSTLNKVIIILSLIFIRSPIGYLRNGFSFQGILNHPNLFGITMVIAITVIVLEQFLRKKISKIDVIILIIAIIELLLSNSRTSFISLFVCLFLVFIFSKIKLNIKILTLLLSSLLLGFLYSLPLVNSYITNYIRKGQSSDDILLSRYGQIGNAKYVLNSEPLFGIGFGIPLNRTSISLDDYVFEAGNLLFGIIIFSGLFGLICYIAYILSIIFINKKINFVTLPLFICTLMINMGEMIMFSTNNYGVLCYLLWGLYINKGKYLSNEQI